MLRVKPLLTDEEKEVSELKRAKLNNLVCPECEGRITVSKTEMTAVPSKAQFTNLTAFTSIYIRPQHFFPPDC